MFVRQMFDRCAWEHGGHGGRFEWNLWNLSASAICVSCLTPGHLFTEEVQPVFSSGTGLLARADVDAMPFRLTRNIQRFIGPFRLSGTYAACLAAISGCLVEVRTYSTMIVLPLDALVCSVNCFPPPSERERGPTYHTSTGMSADCSVHFHTPSLLPTPTCATDFAEGLSPRLPAAVFQ